MSSFEEFFSSGKEESISPFLNARAKKWSKNLDLKISLLGLLCLILAYVFSRLMPPLSNIFLIFVYFLCGTPFLITTFRHLRSLEVNIDVLTTLSAFLAFFIGSGIEGAFLLVLFDLASALDEGVMSKAKNALFSLHKIAPQKAYIITPSGKLVEKSVREVEIGELTLVKVGETVPLDGEVVEGSSAVDMAHLTGETKPVTKTIKDTVQAGSKNLEGPLTIKVTRISSNSTLSQVIQLVAEAQDSKPKAQRFFDRFGKWYASIVIGLSALFAILIPLLIDIPYLGREGSIYRAIAFLIAASPCALVIAMPMAYFSAISSCARKGVLIKGGAILDLVRKCKSIAFDKTGTLTTGELKCISIKALGNVTWCNEDLALAFAAGLERGAKHPIAKAINDFAELKKIKISEIKNFKSIPGSGLEGVVEVDNKPFSVYIGHWKYISNIAGKSEKDVEKSPELSTFLFVDGQIFIFSFSDVIRESAKNAVLDLRERFGFKTIMLTGDHSEQGQAVGLRLGIDEVFTDLTPHDKFEKVVQIDDKEPLIMVGDGVNDAPAIARATVGISMGGIGTMAAIDASDVIFLREDLTLVSFLIQKSKKILRIVNQNLILASAVILLAIFPALFGFLPLWMVVILHEGGTVLVSLNSLRLFR